MKFKIDQNLPLEFEKILSSNGHDAISVFNQGLNGAPDERIVSVCHDEGRALITAARRKIVDCRGRQAPGTGVDELDKKAKISIAGRRGRRRHQASSQQGVSSWKN